MVNPLLVHIPLDSPSLTNKALSISGTCRKGLLFWLLILLGCAGLWSFSENQGLRGLWPWLLVASVLSLASGLIWARFGRITHVVAPFLIVSEAVLLGSISVLGVTLVGPAFYCLVGAGLASSLALFMTCSGLRIASLAEHRERNVVVGWLWLLSSLLFGLLAYLSHWAGLPLPAFVPLSPLKLILTGLFVFLLLRRQLDDLIVLERGAGLTEHHYEWSAAAALLFNIVLLLPALGLALFNRLRYHSFWERM